MNDAARALVSDRSDVESFQRAARELMARALMFFGPEDPQAVAATIEAVRGVADPGYTTGDAQVDLQLVASANADERIAVALEQIDTWDRAVLLRHVTRLVLSRGDISPETATLLEGMGVLLQLEASDIEYVVVSEMNGEH